MLTELDISSAIRKIDQIFIEAQQGSLPKIVTDNIRQSFQDSGECCFNIPLPNPELKNSILLNSVRVKGPGKVATNPLFANIVSGINDRFKEKFQKQVSCTVIKDEGVYKMMVNIRLL